MKGHRFPFDVAFWSGDDAEIRHSRAGQQFRFDLDALNSFCLGGLPRRLTDLLRIASAVYVVDRVVRRRSKDRRKDPSRTIGVRLGVLDYGFWNQPRVLESVRDVLEFVTSDFWEIDFERDSQEYHWPECFLPFSRAQTSPLICLYSSGLDSAAGLVARMNKNPDRPVIPVTVWHQPRQRHLVHQQYKLIREHYRSMSISTQIEPLIVKVAMVWRSAGEQRQQERSQRSRSFLFAALGAIAAIMHEQRTVEMFESGVGAINLPLMAGMVGSKATRSSHPEFLRLMSNLVSLIAETEVEFVLPFANWTKGELVKVLAAAPLHKLAASTASCVGFPLRHPTQRQCGLCPACIFRRAAMQVAGIPEAEDTYRYDFLSQQNEVFREKRLAYLKAFLLQVSHLREIENTGRLPAAFERHVAGTGIVPRNQSQKGVMQLLSRYRDEWEQIVSAARDKGCAWASLLAPKRPAAQGVIHAST